MFIWVVLKESVQQVMTSAGAKENNLQKLQGNLMQK